MRSRVLALVVLGSCGAGIAAVKWLAEHAAPPALESLLEQALGRPEDLNRLVRAHPEAARRLVERLAQRGLEARKIQEGGDREFERALQIARSIDTCFRDRSLTEATAFKRDLGPKEAAQELQADRLAEQAETDYRAGRWQEAKAGAVEVLAIYRELGDGWGELRAIHALGNIHMILGEVEEARRFYADQLDKSRELGDRYRGAAALNNLSRLQELRGNLREAARGYRRVWSLAKEHGLRRIEGFALLYQGNLYHRLGLHDRASVTFQRAETVFHQLGEAGLEAAVASNRGASLQRLGEHDEALTAYQRSLSLRMREGDLAGRIPTLLHVAELLHETGQTMRAMAVLKQILGLTRDQGDAASRQFRWGALVSAADIHLAGGEVEAARENILEAEAIARDVGDALDEVETSRRRAQILLLEGSPVEAVAELENAVAVIEKLRTSPEVEEERIRFLGAQESVFEQLAGIHLRRLENPRSAFEILEQSRSRAFLDSLQGRVFLRPGDAGAYQVLLTSSAESLPLDRVASRLPAQGLLLHYTVAPDWMAVIAVDSRGLRYWTVEETDPTELERGVGALSRKIAGEAPDWEDEAERLSRWLLGSLEDVIGPYDTLIIVPDGVLFEVPWAALKWRGKYLVEDHDIVVQASASIFVRLAERRPRSRSSTVLLVANPSADGTGALRDTPGALLRPLPEAEAEAEELRSLLPGSKVLVRERADEKTVRFEMGEHGVVHFGTHAFIVPEHALASSLLLAGGAGAIGDIRLAPVDPADGVLTGYEVLSLDLQPQALITLAACESLGRGPRRGEGVVGLARAFFEAGAGSVVASLWPVEDRATRELMVRFYRAFHSGRRRTADALRIAQAAMANGEMGESRRHPYYWAGFLFIGDGR